MQKTLKSIFFLLIIFSLAQGSEQNEVIQYQQFLHLLKAFGLDPNGDIYLPLQSTPQSLNAAKLLLQQIENAVIQFPETSYPHKYFICAQVGQQNVVSILKQELKNANE